MESENFICKKLGYQTTLDIDSMVGIVALFYGITKKILLSQAIGNLIIIIAYICVLNGIFKCMGLKKNIKTLGIILFFIPYTIGQLGYSSILFSSVSWYSVKIFGILLSIYIIFEIDAEGLSKKISCLLILACVCSFLTGISSGFYILLCGIFPLFFYGMLSIMVKEETEKNNYC